MDRAKYVRKAVEKMGKRLKARLERHMGLVEEAAALEKLRLRDLGRSGGNGIKVISWNARFLVKNVGKQQVNKALWIRHSCNPEVICIQESYIDCFFPGYDVYNGLKRFAPGKPANFTDELIKEVG